MSDENDTKEDGLPPISIFGVIFVERKVTILALATFILSIITALYGLFSILRGSDVEILKPSFLVFYRHDYKDTRPYTRIASELIYSNDGDPGHNTVIKHSGVKFKLDDREYKFVWLAKVYTEDGTAHCNRQLGQRGTSDNPLNARFPFPRRSQDEPLVYNCPNDGAKLSIQLLKRAKATVLPAGSTLADEAIFEAQENLCDEGMEEKECQEVKYANFLKWDTFVQKVKNIRQLDLWFFVETTDEESEEVRCTIYFTKDDYEELTNENWERLPCW